ncbi:MAG: ABC transporter ATP-binding protein [Candidatus Marithrix sp.]
MNNSNLIVNLKNVNKYFSTKSSTSHVIKNVCYSIQKGEFIAITGESGSGKSTLLSIIGLLEFYDSGEYELCGQEISTLDEWQLNKLRNNNIGWIFQNFNLISDMTVAENILLPLRYSDDKNTQENMKTHLDNILINVGLEGRQHSYPNELSGGQQQRVAIARALITNPDLILADEPTGNLDSKTADMIFELLVKLNVAGKTIVMVTHSPRLAKLAGHRLIMKDGKIENE